MFKSRIMFSLTVVIGTYLILGSGPATQTIKTRDVALSDIPAYLDKIKPQEPIATSVKWLQPTNKREDCKMKMWGARPISEENREYTITWDGDCENGKASGLGKLIGDDGAVAWYNIGFVKGGVTQGYYYSGLIGESTVRFGEYEIIDGEPTFKSFDNWASLNDSGEIDYVFASVETDDKTGLSKGGLYRKYNDGAVWSYGYFGNDRIVGSRKFYDLNKNITMTMWGLFSTETDKPEGYVYIKNSNGLWGRFFEFGNAKDYVNLPEAYGNDLSKISDEGERVSNKASQKGRYAIAMYKRYQSVNGNIDTPENTNPPSKSRGISTGTGFFISDDGYLLTNSHVIDGSRDMSVLIDGQEVSAKLVDQDSSNDIALLKVDLVVDGLPIELKEKSKQGSDISVLGYPNIGLQGNEQKATFGFINANSGVQGDTRYFQISAPIQPGNSGSPLLNSKGVVIGIASASLNQSAALQSSGALAQNVNYAVKIVYALPMLIKHSVDYVETDKSKVLGRTELIENVSESVVLVIAK